MQYNYAKCHLLIQGLNASCQSGPPPAHLGGMHSKVVITSSLIFTSNKNFIQKYFRCRDGKEQEQELGWRVSVLPIPAFHHCEISGSTVVLPI